MTRINRIKDITLTNQQVIISSILFAIGAILLKTKVNVISGALFGAASSFLGSWVSEINSKRKEQEKSKVKENEARKLFTPELNRVIERVLFIHSRAIANFSSESVDYFKNPLQKKIPTNDQKIDFIPYLPVLYPRVEQFKDLNSEDAMSLIEFYDSLYELESSVNDWWEREGQLSVNLHLRFLTNTDRSLKLAETCVTRFNMDELFPPRYSSWDSLSSRIKKSQDNSRVTFMKHIDRAGTK